MGGSAGERAGGRGRLARQIALRLYSPFAQLFGRCSGEPVAAETAGSVGVQPDPRRHDVQFSLKRIFAVIALGSLATLAVVAQDQKKQWKDRAEYDLFDSANKEQNANTKLQILNNWKQKYPASDFKVDRQETIMTTYQAMGNAKEMLNAAKELVSLDAKNVKGLYWINLLTVSLQDKSPEALETGDNAAKGLLDAIPVFFDPAKKPATTSDDDWKKSRLDMETIGHRTLGWTAMQRSQNEVAEKEFLTVLQNNPNDAEASLWAGTVIAKQRKLEKQSAALYQIARAAYFEGQGALPPATRTPLQAYLEKTYINFHGSREGLDQVVEAAKKSALPPADFKIESNDEILAKQEEELKKTNPQLALWIKIKQELSGPGGQKYFEEGLKEHALPGLENVKKFKATVVSTAPEKKPTMVIVGISSKDMSEVTLKFEKPLAAIPEKGTEIEFSGSPSAFTADPQMLTFDVSPEDVTGLPKPAPPKRAPVKKATTAKKAAANN
jgi:hypothetical protein